MYVTPDTPPDGLATAELIRKGSLSRTDAVRDALARVRRVNAALNALVDDLGEKAPETALPDNGGRFSGVPTLVKDLFMPVAGARMTNGSLLGREAVASFDAEVVSRLRATGAVILGTTTSPEFGTSFVTESCLSGVTRNPWCQTASKNDPTSASKCDPSRRGVMSR
jgi:amidase